jgi:predicted ATPase
MPFVDELTTRPFFALLDLARGVMRPGELRLPLLGLVFIDWATRSQAKDPQLKELLRDLSQPSPVLGREIEAWKIRATAREHPLAAFIPDGYAWFDRAPDVLVAALEWVRGAASEVGHQSVFEFVLEQFALQEGARGGEWFTPTSVRRLLVELARPHRGLIYDPAAGSGSLLIDGAKYAVQHQGEATVAGQEINRTAWQVANMNALIAGVAADIGCGDTLRDDLAPNLKADYIVSVPPFALKLPRGSMLANDPRWTGYADAAAVSNRDATWLWVVHALHHLSGDGVACLVLTPAALRNKPSGLTRMQMLDDGFIEAVIGLPPNMFLSSGISTRVLVLRKGRPARHGNVLFIDAQRLGLASRRPRVGVELTDEDIRRIGRLHRGWVDGERVGLDPECPAWTVPTDEILGGAPYSLELSDWQTHSDDRLAAEPDLTRRLIRRMQISNLKSIRSADVGLAPITLFYGPNSAGKTSFIQSLLLLKQTLTQQAQVTAPRLMTSGPSAELGSFAGLLHGHDLDRSLALGLEFASTSSDLLPAGYSRTTRFAFAQEDGGGRVRQTRFDVGIGPHRFEFEALPEAYEAAVGTSARFAVCSDLQAFADVLEDPLITALTQRRAEPSAELGDRIGSSRALVQEWKARAEEIRRWLLGQLDPIEPPKTMEFSADAFMPRESTTVAQLWTDARRAERSELRAIRAGLEDVSRMFAEVGAELETLLREMTHLGPLRAAPARFHQLSGGDEGHIGSTGENLASVLYWHPGLVDEVNGWLRRLGVAYEVRVSQVTSSDVGRSLGDLVAMVLHDKRSGFEVSPKDVGFGVSQLLPIVAQLLTARQAVTCIEQPEIHVHPKLQTELGDLLIEATSDERGNQVLVETHSEHLMLRLQRRIRAGDLDPERVSVIYIDAARDGSAIVQRLRLDDEGNFIDPWPQGFFAERLDELFGDA